jgi:carbonic anhydrase
LERLEAGNKRFREGASLHPHQGIDRRLETAMTQMPFAAVLTCSDSRVSPVVLFDAGIGDLFIIRTAGNIVWELELASIEYAVEHLGVSAIVVMGHSDCGAIKAYLNGKREKGHIQRIIESLAEEIEEQEAIKTDSVHRLAACIEANVRHQVRYIVENSEIIQEKLRNKSLVLAAAEYMHESGEVRLRVFEEEGMRREATKKEAVRKVYF